MVQDLVGEYMVTGDAEEAARCWHDLGVGFYGHQLIFTILLSAFEAPAKAELLLQLIKRFAASGEVSQVAPNASQKAESLLDMAKCLLLLFCLEFEDSVNECQECRPCL